MTSSVTFSPWIGTHYGRESRWGLSVLLLGESHYDEGFNQGNQLTTFVIQRHIQRAGRQYPFWTKIARAFGSAPYETETERRLFWHSVAFYNYVQDFVGTAARVRPTEAQLRSAWQPFCEVAAELKPDVTVTLGFALWDQLSCCLPPRLPLDVPDFIEHRAAASGIVQAGNRSGQFAVFPAARPAAGVIGYVKHPSGGFSHSFWSRWINALLAESRARIGRQKAMTGANDHANTATAAPRVRADDSGAAGHGARHHQGSQT